MSDRRALLRDWPNRDASRFVRACGFSWHVQIMGSGPPLLLLHGTAASTHSFRDLAPLLAPHFTVIAPDLPGHGLTETPAAARLSLPGMAGALRALLQVLNLTPSFAAGHSAGAAVALRMTLDNAIAPRAVIGLNPALLPLSGVAGQIFSPLAKLLVGLPLLPGLFAWRARGPGVVEKLLADTGSRIDPRGVDLYTRLISDRRHTAAALSMMAQWNLQALLADLPRLIPPMLLLIGANDRAVSPAQADEAARLIPNAHIQSMPGLGHLAHEEAPDATAAAIHAFTQQTSPHQTSPNQSPQTPAQHAPT